MLWTIDNGLWTILAMAVLFSPKPSSTHVFSHYKTFKMETNNILNADVLDIIFDGRNKQYGAYQLRKNYNRRLAVSVVAMFGCCLLAIAGKALAKNDGNKIIAPKVADGFVLVEIKDKPVTPPPPPPPKPQPKVEKIKVTPPLRRR